MPIVFRTKQAFSNRRGQESIMGLGDSKSTGLETLDKVGGKCVMFRWLLGRVREGHGESLGQRSK